MWLYVAIAVLSLVGFLVGLQTMRQGLEGLGEGRLPELINRFVKTPTRGIITGTVVTALVQSSAAITAISVGMVASGSLLFKDAVGVVLGSNVGSTVTPQLLSFDLWVFALPCVLFGAIAWFQRHPKWHFAGQALLGFGMIFIALEVLKTALSPLSKTIWFRLWLEQAGHHPLAAVLVGCAASAMIQSSTATTVISMALASQGLIQLDGAIAIVLGANIGTCITSVIAAIGQSRPAQQVALAHVLLNVAGVALFLPMLAPYTHWMQQLTKNPAQQIANAHTFFNVACTLIVWPITKQFSSLVEWCLPNQART